MKHYLYPVTIVFLGILFSLSGNIFSQTPQQAKLPMPDHIVVVIMENHGYDRIIGAASAPHINAIAIDDHSALFTQSFAIEHPSQPNYFDLFAGCNQGVTDDSKPTNLPFTTDNLGSQLIGAGRTFTSYSEDLPSVGYNGSPTGNYARKHNPSANWMGTGTNQYPITVNQPFTAFPTDFSLLPTVSFVIPNLKNDMHDGGDPGGIITGDNWVYQKLNAYIQWAKTHNSLLILTFDEDDGYANNKITTIFTGQMVKAGQYPETINHYSVLRTIEDMYGLPYACNAAAATPITDSWIFSSGVAANKSTSFTLYPNPFKNITHCVYTIPKESEVHIALLDMSGKVVKIISSGRLSAGEHTVTFDASDLASGSYIFSLESGGERLTREIIVTK